MTNGYIAMNRFKVRPGCEAEFEELWLNRESQLHDTPGFKSFKMLKGEDGEDHRLYISHSEWKSYEDFVSWTKSAAFRAAHKDVGPKKDLYLEPPFFEGFAVIQEI